MKRKHLITLAAAVVGAVMLTASAVATYATASGYSAAKNAAKNLLNEDNLTLTATAELLVDDKSVQKDVIIQKFDKDGLIKYSSEQTGINGRDYREYMQDGMKISVYDSDGNGILDSRDSVRVNDMSSEEMVIDGIWLFEFSKSEENKAAVRFAELLADTFVGDLKNNIILTNSTDDSDTYTMTLDTYQIPELYQAGLEMIMAQENRGDIIIDGKKVSDMTEEEFYGMLEEDEYGSFYLLFNKNPDLSGADAYVTVGKDGRLREADGKVFLTGRDRFDKEHTVTLHLNFTVSDYDTTICDRADLSLFEDSKKLGFGTYDYEERLADVNRQIEKADLQDKDMSDEEKEDYINSLIEERDALQAAVDSPDYAKYSEIRNSLLFAPLTDEERTLLVAEKFDILQKGNIDPYSGIEIAETFAEEVEVTVDSSEGRTTMTVVNADETADAE